MKWKYFDMGYTSKGVPVFLQSVIVRNNDGKAAYILKALETKINLNYIDRFSSYHTENTQCLHYKTL